MHFFSPVHHEHAVSNSCQERASDPQELELLAVVSCPVGAQVLWKSNQCSYRLSPFSSLWKKNID